MNLKLLKILFIILFLSSLVWGAIVWDHELPKTNNTYDLGSAALRWQDVFAVNVNSTTLTDGTASLSAGVLSGVVNFTVDDVTIADLLTVADVSISSAGDSEATLNATNLTITTTDSFTGVTANYAKTAGVTNSSDDFLLADLDFALNQSGGTIGEVRIVDGKLTLTDGTADVAKGILCEVEQNGGAFSDDVYGGHFLVDLNAGTAADSVYGAKIDVSQAVGHTSITSDVFGLNITGALLSTVNGTAYMLFLQSGTNFDYGIYDAAGKDWVLHTDSQKIYFGAGKDGYIEQDADSMNIVANAVTATDDFFVTADNFTINSYGVGIGVATAVNKQLHIVMDATDVHGVYVNGDTNPYAGSSWSHAVSLRRTYDWSSAIITDAGVSGIIGYTSYEGTSAVLEDATDIGVFGVGITMNHTDDVSSERATAQAYSHNVQMSYYTNDADYDSAAAGALSVNTNGFYANLHNDATMADSGGTGNNNAIRNTCFYAHIDSDPTLVVDGGNGIFHNRGLFVDVAGTTAGWSVNYGIYISAVTGADINWGINDNSGADWALDSDSAKIYLGEVQDGYIEFDSDSINIVSNDETATDDLVLDQDQLLIGDDGGATNYAEFKADGELNLYGTARVTKRLTLCYYTASMGGGNELYIRGRDADPDADEYIVWTAYIPNDIASGTDVVVSFRWCPTVNEVGDATDTYVVWQGYYNSAGSSGVIGAATTVSAWNATVPDAQVARTIHEETYATVSGLSAGDFLSVYLNRDADNGSDTYPQDAMVFVTAFITYTADRLGTAT